MISSPLVIAWLVTMVTTISGRCLVCVLCCIVFCKLFQPYSSWCDMVVHLAMWLMCLCTYSWGWQESNTDALWYICLCTGPAASCVQANDVLASIVKLYFVNFDVFTSPVLRSCKTCILTLPCCAIWIFECSPLISVCKLLLLDLQVFQNLIIITDSRDLVCHECSYWSKVPLLQQIHGSPWSV